MTKLRIKFEREKEKQREINQSLMERLEGLVGHNQSISDRYHTLDERIRRLEGSCLPETSVVKFIDINFFFSLTLYGRLIQQYKSSKKVISDLFFAGSKTFLYGRKPQHSSQC